MRALRTSIPIASDHQNDRHDTVDVQSTSYALQEQVLYGFRLGKLTMRKQ